MLAGQHRAHVVRPPVPGRHREHVVEVADHRPAVVLVEDELAGGQRRLQRVARAAAGPAGRPPASQSMSNQCAVAPRGPRAAPATAGRWRARARPGPCGWGPRRRPARGRARARSPASATSPLSPPSSSLTRVWSSTSYPCREPGTACRIGREVEVGDAEVGEVGHDGLGVGEGEPGVQLEAVGGGHASVRYPSPAARDTSAARSALARGGPARRRSWCRRRGRCAPPSRRAA